jgi:hypothetical protein
VACVLYPDENGPATASGAEQPPRS